MDRFTEAMSEITAYRHNVSLATRPALEIPSKALGLLADFFKTCERHGATLNMTKILRTLATMEEAGKKVESALADFDEARAILGECLPAVNLFLEEHGEKLAESYRRLEELKGLP